MNKKLTGVYIFTFLFLHISYARDLENLNVQNPVIVTGLFTTYTKYYNASGIEDRFDPFIFTTAGSLTLNVYGTGKSISLLYSGKISEMRQPINRFRIAPISSKRSI